MDYHRGLDGFARLYIEASRQKSFTFLAVSSMVIEPKSVIFDRFLVDFSRPSRDTEKIVQKLSILEIENPRFLRLIDGPRHDWSQKSRVDFGVKSTKMVDLVLG